MTIREKIIIRAPVTEVWPYVADPALHARWNPKVVQVERSGEGPVRPGESYAITYRMSGRQTRMQAQVEECVPPARLRIRLRQAEWAYSRSIVESYELHEQSAGTRLVQTIDMTHAGLPLWVKPAVWFISRFGRPVGRRYLERLGSIVEAGHMTAS